MAKKIDPAKTALKIKIAFMGGWLSFHAAMNALKAIGYTEFAAEEYLHRETPHMMVIRA